MDRAARSTQRAANIIDLEAKRIARSMQENANKGAAGFTGALQQISYQVGDFAVQLASGGSALTAFIQQGSQVAGAFGPWGAAIGAVGAIVGATAHALLGFDDEAKKTPDLVGDTITAFNNLATAAEDARKKIAGLSDAQKAFVGAQAETQAQTEGVDAAKLAQGLASTLRGGFLREEQAKLPARPASQQEFEQGAQQAIGAANQRVAAAAQQLQTAAQAGKIDEVASLLQKMGIAGTPEANSLAETTARIAAAQAKKAVTDELLNRSAPVQPLDDTGNTSAFALLPDSKDIEAQVRATEAAAEAKARAEEQAATKAEQARKAAADKVAREREQAARELAQRVAAVTREAATPQDVYNQRVAEADDLLKKGAISAELYAKAIARAKEELDKASKPDDTQLDALIKSQEDRWRAELQQAKDRRDQTLLALEDEAKRTKEQDPAGYYKRTGDVDLAPIYDAKAGITDALREMQDESQQFGKIFGDAVRGGAEVATDAISAFVLTGKLNVQSLAQSIETSLVQGAVRQLVNSLIGVGGQALAGYFAPGAAGTGAGTSPWAGSYGPAPNAKGGVYDGPGISAYSNSIVSSPTLFAFAKGGAIGLMGERGSEAIVPLGKTSSGDLGVKVADALPSPSGGVVVNINDNRSSGEQVQTNVRRSGDQTVIDVMIRDAHRKQVNSGEQDGLYKANYGSRPKPLR